MTPIQSTLAERVALGKERTPKPPLHAKSTSTTLATRGGIEATEPPHLAIRQKRAIRHTVTNLSTRGSTLSEYQRLRPQVHHFQPRNHTYPGIQGLTPRPTVDWLPRTNVQSGARGAHLAEATEPQTIHGLCPLVACRPDLRHGQRWTGCRGPVKDERVE